MAIRVILVDDHQIVRDGVRLLLNQAGGFTIVGEAGNTTDAIVSLKQFGCDLLLLDLNLPGEAGVSAVQKMRGACPTAKILVLSGDTAGQLVHDALVDGASGFVRKEQALDLLATAIRSVANGKTFLCVESTTALAENLRTRARISTQPVLSERESALLRGIAGGLRYKEIAKQIGISAKSVETYRTRLAKKLGLSTRADFVRYAAQSATGAG